MPRRNDIATITPQANLLAPQLDYILLDGSGSMSDKWWDTLAGIQAFCKVLTAENVHSHAILHVFDSMDMEFLQRDDLLCNWAPLNGSQAISYHGGGTPLNDAVNIMCRRLADLDPPRASIVIVTDGGENGSKATTTEQACNLLDWCRAKGWQVTFLGADFSNYNQAKKLGANEKNTVGVAKARLADAGKRLGEKRLNNIRSGKDMDFSREEQEDFGGYLAGPSGSPWSQGGAPETKD